MRTENAGVVGEKIYEVDSYKLKEDIESLLDDYKTKKLGDIQVDSDTDYDIHKCIEWATKCISEQLDEMDEDIDIYIEDMNQPKEDIYSIVNSSFIPSGLECDCYSVVGNILEIGAYRNEVTGEEVYNMLLECNDNIISVGINKKDLHGMPQAGCRFIGKIWLQGYIDFKELDSEH